MKLFIILSIAGAVAGFVNGFFGTGAGLVVFAVLSFLGLCVRKALATANLVILVLSAVSFFVYIKTGALSWEGSADFLKSNLLFVLTGGALGALLSGKLKPSLLKGIFCILVIICGIRMVMG